MSALDSSPFSHRSSGHSLFPSFGILASWVRLQVGNDAEDRKDHDFHQAFHPLSKTRAVACCPGPGVHGWLPIRNKIEQARAAIWRKNHRKNTAGWKASIQYGKLSGGNRKTTTKAAVGMPAVGGGALLDAFFILSGQSAILMRISSLKAFTSSSVIIW